MCKTGGPRCATALRAAHDRAEAALAAARAAEDRARHAFALSSDASRPAARADLHAARGAAEFAAAEKRAALVDWAATPSGHSALAAMIDAEDPLSMRAQDLRDALRAADDRAVFAAQATPAAAAAAPEPTRFPVWTRGQDNQAVLHGDYATFEEQFAAMRTLGAPGSQAWIGKAGETAQSASERIAESDRFRVVADERAGRGPDPRRPGDYGIAHELVDAELWEAADQFGVENPHEDNEGDPDCPGPWTSMGKEHVLDPADPVSTCQDWISGTHVAALVRDMPDGTGLYAKPGAADEPWTLPRLYRHSNGRLYLLDGNHTVAAGRAAGRPVQALVIDHEDLADWKSMYDDDDGD